MGDYERGVIDGMRERFETDLETAAMSIAVLKMNLIRNVRKNGMRFVS